MNAGSEGAIEGPLVVCFKPEACLTVCLVAHLSHHCKVGSGKMRIGGHRMRPEGKGALFLGLFVCSFRSSWRSGPSGLSSRGGAMSEDGKTCRPFRAPRIGAS